MAEDEGKARQPAKRAGRASSPVPPSSGKEAETKEAKEEAGKQQPAVAAEEEARTWPDVPGSYYHLVQVGARLSPIETLVVYILPIFFVLSSLRETIMWNALTQLILFIPVVEIPTLLTGHMFYVDIGWPTGLVLLAFNAMYYGTGWWWRRALLGGVMCLHGSRMALGALAMFYPYRAEQDIPRYRYAKVRFMTKDGMPEKLWPVKMIHDSMQQWAANAFSLAVPVLLPAFNASESFHPLELLGALLWALCWLWENVADGQKMLFLSRSKWKAAGDVNTAVLGHAPYDGKAYWLWTLCRHPNYFGEWMSWNAIMVSCLPSLFACADPVWIKAGFLLTLVMISRILYDCLVYWTGSEPAEHFSVQKRAAYKDYQRTTRVFFPFEVPYVNHARVEGWPNPTKSK